MFGFSLREKTESVIKELFIFYVEDVHRPTFESIVSQAKASNQNEYSAAFFYMLIRMNMMVQPFDSETDDGLIDPKDGRTKEETKQVQDFIQNDRELNMDREKPYTKADINKALERLSKKSEIMKVSRGMYNKAPF